MDEADEYQPDSRFKIGDMIRIKCHSMPEWNELALVVPPTGQYPGAPKSFLLILQSHSQDFVGNRYAWHSKNYYSYEPASELERLIYG